MRRSAFTLLELLVSIILTSLLIGLMLVSYRFLMVNFKKAHTIFPERAVAYHQYRSVLEAAVHYVYWEYDARGRVEGKPKLYFDGTASHVRLISAKPLYGDKIAIIEMACVGGNLIYREQPLYSASTDFNSPALSDVRHTLTLMTGSQCRFDFRRKDQTVLATIHDALPKVVGLTLRQGENTTKLNVAIKGNFNANVTMVDGLQNPL